MRREKEAWKGGGREEKGKLETRNQDDKEEDRKNRWYYIANMCG